MVSSRSGYGARENPSNPNAQETNEGGRRKKISEYEQSREERIRENLERMQKLGIFDLSLKVKAHKPTCKARKTPYAGSTPPNSSPLPPPGPVRRSSRLQSVTAVSYSEALPTKKDKPLESEVDLSREEGSKPEFYTEEHDKLLGSTKMGWTLFVDGVGKDGKRIYDPVNGKTCHQCRQKTLGRRTHCSKCNLVQGQFCGDCLYMRYGENVIEANQNPSWICPVCRGICNCSLCRQARGWPPTGPLYRKISRLGYKSVAHFLIQTRRLKTETEADSNNKVPISAKRSLPFTHVEETSTEMVLMDCNIDPQVSRIPEYEGENLENLPCDNREEKTHILGGGEGDLKQEEKSFSDKEHSDCKQEEKIHFLDNEQGKSVMEMMKLVIELDAEDSLHLGPRGKETHILADKHHDCSNVPGEESILPNKAGVPISSHDQKGTFQTELKINESNDKFSSKKGDKTSHIGNSEIDCTLAPESSPKSNKKRVRTIEPAGDSIAGRLRPRRNRENEQEDHRLIGTESGSLGITQDKNGISPQLSAEADVNNPNSSSEATVTNNISKRLRKRCNGSKEQAIHRVSALAIVETDIDISSPVATITSSKSKKKPIHTCPDSIAGRLRQRRAPAGGGV